MLAFHQENIQTLEEYLHPFPCMEDIFVPEQPWLKAHFLPLISIDLSALNPKWQGQTVHMINPFEPYEGLIYRTQLAGLPPARRQPLRIFGQQGLFYTQPR